MLINTLFIYYLFYRFGRSLQTFICTPPVIPRNNLGSSLAWIVAACYSCCFSCLCWPFCRFCCSSLFFADCAVDVWVYLLVANRNTANCLYFLHNPLLCSILSHPSAYWTNKIWPDSSSIDIESIPCRVCMKHDHDLYSYFFLDANL